jgi:hypothetical protein
MGKLEMTQRSPFRRLAIAAGTLWMGVTVQQFLRSPFGNAVFAVTLFLTPILLSRFSLLTGPLRNWFLVAAGGAFAAGYFWGGESPSPFAQTVGLLVSLAVLTCASIGGLFVLQRNRFGSPAGGPSQTSPRSPERS